MSQAVIARTAEEVQRAHDILTSVILDEMLRAAVFGPHEAHSFEHVKTACDVLCWLLGHDHNTTFEKNLKTLVAVAEREGFQMVDMGELQKPKKPN